MTKLCNTTISRFINAVRHFDYVHHYTQIFLVLKSYEEFQIWSCRGTYFDLLAQLHDELYKQQLVLCSLLYIAKT